MRVGASLLILTIVEPVLEVNVLAPAVSLAPHEPPQPMPSRKGTNVQHFSTHSNNKYAGTKTTSYMKMEMASGAFVQVSEPFAIDTLLSTFLGSHTSAANQKFTVFDAFESL